MKSSSAFGSPENGRNLGNKGVQNWGWDIRTSRKKTFAGGAALGKNQRGSSLKKRKSGGESQFEINGRCLLNAANPTECWKGGTVKTQGRNVRLL